MTRGKRGISVVPAIGVGDLKPPKNFAANFRSPELGMKYISWDAALCPPEGTALIICMCAGPVSVGHKEPAGISFQRAILTQKGLLSKWTSSIDARNRNFIL